MYSCLSLLHRRQGHAHRCPTCSGCSRRYASVVSPMRVGHELLPTLLITPMESPRRL